MISRTEISTREDLALAYTPGVAESCLAIASDINKSYELTRRWNTVAVVTDGTAVLGLGDIGPEAAMPVMEGKAVLFKELAGVDAIPLCIRSKSVDEIVNTICLLAGSFGGINLEDISAPRCFEIERKLKDVCDIPIFHDDQHGTAIVVLASVINALKIVDKGSDVSVVINGAGAAGTATSRLLSSYGIDNIVLCDKEGALDSGLSLAETMEGSDIFIGLSGPNCVTTEMVASMNKKAVVLALANPVPEIMPDAAKLGGAAVVATGRSDFPNQVNNVLAFPGVFRGVLDIRASDITEQMKIAAAKAIAEYIEPSVDYILPSPLDKGVAAAVAKDVIEAYGS
jgi:malate dehydrogenase (oxaloacetate-decarboxylating)